MNDHDVILIIDACMWLLLLVLPFLVGLVFLSCWLRNRAHRQRQQVIEQIMLQQLDVFAQTGQWPELRTREQRRASRLLRQRLALPAEIPSASLSVR